MVHQFKSRIRNFWHPLNKRHQVSYEIPAQGDPRFSQDLRIANGVAECVDRRRAERDRAHTDQFIADLTRFYRSIEGSGRENLNSEEIDVLVLYLAIVQVLEALHCDLRPDARSAMYVDAICRHVPQRFLSFAERDDVQDRVAKVVQLCLCSARHAS